MSDQLYVRLNTGASMPQLGFGTFAIDPNDATEAVSTAIRTGYRSIDTASDYKNEQQVGDGIKASGVDRGELFVTTKLWIEDYGHDEALRAFDVSMEKLGLDYLDLYLLHWPLPMEFERTIAAYKALEPVLASGRIRALGVSNFNPDHLEKLSQHSDVVPAVNQIELSPLLSQRVPKAANTAHGIVTEAWSPIGGQDRVGDVLKLPVITGIADKLGKTPTQVILRWHLQLGNVVIPRSTNADHIASNFDVFDFALSESDMRAIDGLNVNERGGPDPDKFDLEAFKKLMASQS